MSANPTDWLRVPLDLEDQPMVNPEDCAEPPKTLGAASPWVNLAIGGSAWRADSLMDSAKLSEGAKIKFLLNYPTMAPAGFLSAHASS
jgi:hypothetical protein